MTSPSAGMAHGGYLFQDEETKEDVFSSFARSEYTAYTEFGVPCFADVELLKKIIPENELFPITPTDSWVTHHAFHAWGDTRWACLPILEYYFGKIDSLEKAVSSSHWLQYAGYKAIFEEARRQWPHCSMAINWCYDEPWLTAANNSLISYPMEFKPGYFAVKEALRPVLASARIPHFAWKSGDVFSAEIWLLNDSPACIHEEITISIKIGNLEKELLTWQCDPLPGGKNLLGPSIHCVLPDIENADTLELILKTKDETHSSHYHLHYSLRPAYHSTGQLNV
jgi:beta-mannosidase